MGEVSAKIASSGQIAGILSILIGAIIAKDLLEWQFILILLLSIAFGLAKLFLLFKLTNPKHYDSKEVEMLKHVKQGIKFLKATPALILLFMNETLLTIPIHILNNFNQPLFKDAEIAVIFIGIIYVINSLINTIVLQNVTKINKYFTRKQLVNITGIMILLGFLIAALLGAYWYMAVVSYLCIKTANAFRFPLFSQIKNEYIPSKSRATTLSLLSMIDSAFDVIVFTSIGLIANIGLGAIFLGCSIVVFIGLLFPVKIRNPDKIASE